jgi:hypothetical protein
MSAPLGCKGAAKSVPEIYRGICVLDNCFSGQFLPFYRVVRRKVAATNPVIGIPGKAWRMRFNKI